MYNTQKKKDILTLAIKKNRDGELFLLDRLHSIEDQLTEHIEEMKSAMGEMKTEMKEMMQEMKDEMPNLNNAFEMVKGKDADEEKMMNELREMTQEEISKMSSVHEEMKKQMEEKMGEIDKKMGEVKDGKDADEKMILDTMTKKMESHHKNMKAEMPKMIESEMPKMGEPVRDSLETLGGEDRLDLSAIKGLDEELKRIDSKPVRVMGRTGMNNWTHQTFAMNGTDTSVTLIDAIGANGLGGFVFYNGNLLARTTAYTVAASGKTINLLFTPDNGTVIDVIYQSMFRSL